MSSSNPATELAFLTSLFSLFVHQLPMPPPQHPTAKKMTLATTDWQKEQPDLSFPLEGISVIWPVKFIVWVQAYNSVVGGTSFCAGSSTPALWFSQCWAVAGFCNTILQSSWLGVCTPPYCLWCSQQWRSCLRISAYGMSLSWTRSMRCRGLTELVIVHFPRECQSCLSPRQTSNLAAWHTAVYLWDSL